MGKNGQFGNDMTPGTHHVTVHATILTFVASHDISRHFVAIFAQPISLIVRPYVPKAFPDEVTDSATFIGTEEAEEPSLGRLPRLRSSWRDL